MNCDQCRRHLLLEASGELNFWKKRAYWKHLNACTDCRVYRNDTAVVHRLAAQRLLEAEPAPFIHEILLDAARKTPQKRPRPQANGWKPALALAMGILALVTFHSLTTTNAPVQTAIRQNAEDQPAMFSTTAVIATVNEPVPMEPWFDSFEEELLALEKQLVMLETDLDSTDSDTIATDVFNMESWEI